MATPFSNVFISLVNFILLFSVKSAQTPRQPCSDAALCLVEIVSFCKDLVSVCSIVSQKDEEKEEPKKKKKKKKKTTKTNKKKERKKETTTTTTTTTKTKNKNQQQQQQQKKTTNQQTKKDIMYCYCCKTVLVCCHISVLFRLLFFLAALNTFHWLDAVHTPMLNFGYHEAVCVG